MRAFFQEVLGSAKSSGKKVSLATQITPELDAELSARTRSRANGMDDKLPKLTDYAELALWAYMGKGPAKDGPQTNEEREVVRLLLDAWRSEGVDNRLVRGILEQWKSLAVQRHEADGQ